MSKAKTLTAADLFAGAGGLAAGFHMADFVPIFFNEIDEKAAATFKENFPAVVDFVCPIQKLDAKSIKKKSGINFGELDVIIGGPPCQGFSINAPIRSEVDPRNHLFKHYIRLVLEGLKPKFIVLENVPGLVSFNHGKTVTDILSAFKQAGYKTIFRILNAAHYGVPEERWRLIFIGTRLKEIELSFPLPIHHSLQRPNFTGGSQYTFKDAIRPKQADLFHKELYPPITVGEALSDLPKIESGGGLLETDYTLPPKSKYQEKLRRGSKKIYNHECVGVSPVNLKRMSFVKPGGSWRDIPHELLPKGLQRARRSDHTKRYGRLDPNKPSCTIMTKCDPHWGTFIHYGQNRIISVREAARIQSFPDWFRFTGSKIDQYRQVGNAVPPLLAKAIADHIKQLLHCDGLHFKSKKEEYATR